MMGNLNKRATFICTLLISFCCTSISAQQNAGVQQLLSYGKVYYDPADSLPVPTTMHDLVPDFPPYDSIHFRCACANSGREKASDCWSECSSDKLGKCFRLYMQYPKTGSKFEIFECYYYYQGEKNYMPDIYLIMDDRLRLREWKK